MKSDCSDAKSEQLQMARMVGLQVTHYHAITICSFQRMIETMMPGVVVTVVMTT